MRSTWLFNKRYFEKLSLGALLLLLLFAGALTAFILIKHEVIGERDEGFDLRIFHWISAHLMDSRLTPFMKGVTYFASAPFLKVAYSAVMLLYLLRKNWKRAADIGVIGMGGFLINYVMKLTFQRVRPPDPLIDRLTNFSFPSGHATSAFIFYGLLAYLVWKTELRRTYRSIIAALLLLFSLLIGFSRIYLRVHYATDVIAGFCTGFAWLVLALGLFRVLKKRTGREVVQGAK